MVRFFESVSVRSTSKIAQMGIVHTVLYLYIRNPLHTIPDTINSMLTSTLLSQILPLLLIPSDLLHEKSKREAKRRKAKKAKKRKTFFCCK